MKSLPEIRNVQGKQLVFTTLSRTASTISNARIYRSLPYPIHKAISKLWNSALTNTSLGKTSYGVNFKIGQISFTLRGPFRYIAGDYQLEYVNEGAYEVQVTNHITGVVQQCRAPRILDVGAHYGWYTIYLAKLVADRGTVFAFEPSDLVYQCLVQNLKLNNLSNVCLYRLPLSDKRESIKMVTSNFRPHERRYMHSLSEHEAIYEDTGDTMTAIAFDELNRAEEIRPNIVKVDVHGSWPKVIEGMKQSLRSDVEHLYLELDCPPRKDLNVQYRDIQHVIATLRDAEMDVYQIVKYRSREGSSIVNADVDNIVDSQIRGGVRTAMLYAVKNSMKTGAAI